MVSLNEGTVKPEGRKKMKTKRLLAASLVACALAGCGGTPVAKVDEGAPAESECAGVHEGEMGKYRDCSTVIVTFRDGSRCIAIQGAGTTCLWIPTGAVTTVPPAPKGE